MSVYHTDGDYCVRVDIWRGKGRRDRWAVVGYWTSHRATTATRAVYPTPEKAEDAAERLWRLYVGGKVGAPNAPPTTVKEAIERFYSRTEGRTGRRLSPRTERAYRSQLAGLIGVAGPLPPSHLTAAHVRAHVDAPPSGHSRAAYLRATRAFVRWMLASGFVRTDVTTNVHVDPGPTLIRPWPSDDEVALVLAAASPATRIRVGFILETGLRISEAVRVRWDWIRWGIGRPTLEVPAADPDGRARKGRRGRSVPLSAAAQEWVRKAGECWGKDGYLLHAGRLVEPGKRGKRDPDTPQNEATWYHDLQPACRLAGEAETKRLERPVEIACDLHGLRRAAGARWLAAGVEPHVAMRWMGHQDLKTFMSHYGGLAEGASAAAMRRVDEAAALPRVGAGRATDGARGVSTSVGTTNQKGAPDRSEAPEITEPTPGLEPGTC
jgi:integrase